MTGVPPLAEQPAARVSEPTHQKRLVRAVRCFYMLVRSPQKVTIDELSRTLSISRRTVFRDISLLREAGIPIQFDSRLGHYRISEAPQANPAWPLSLDESLVLLEAVRRGKSLQDSRRAVMLEAAVTKVIGTVRSHFGGDFHQPVRRSDAVMI